MNSNLPKNLVVKIAVKLDDNWLSLGLTSCVVSIRTADVSEAIAQALQTLGGGTVEAVIGPISDVNG